MPRSQFSILSLLLVVAAIALFLWAGQLIVREVGYAIRTKPYFPVERTAVDEEFERFQRKLEDASAGVSQSKEPTERINKQIDEEMEIRSRELQKEQQAEEHRKSLENERLWRGSILVVAAWLVVIAIGSIAIWHRRKQNQMKAGH
jgi:hypothetical protein